MDYFEFWAAALPILRSLSDPAIWDTGVNDSGGSYVCRFCHRLTYGDPDMLVHTPDCLVTAAQKLVKRYDNEA